MVGNSLLYRAQIEAASNQYSADADAEIVYFLLHMFDRELLNTAGPEARDKIFDRLVNNTLADYVHAVLKPDTPLDVILHLGGSMLDALNERQRVYSQCSCLMSKGPLGLARGSIIFALAFYIHKALRRTQANDVEDVLSGKRDITIEEHDQFPKWVDIMTVKIWAMNILIESTKIWRECIGPLQAGLRGG